MRSAAGDRETDPTTRSPTEGAVRELVAAREAYRRRVRRASQGIVFAMAGVMAINAALPTTPGPYRPGLLFTSGLIVLAGTFWFALVPRELFGAWRVFIATAIAQSVMLVLLLLTGSVASPFFPYYLVPVVVLLFGGSARQVLLLAAVAATGLVGAAVAAGGSLPTDETRDTTVVRLLALGTMAFVAAVAARTTGDTRAELARRTVHLAEATDAAAEAAVTDELTQLYNRRHLRGRLELLVARAEQMGTPFAVVALDLDGLKRVNDRHGHASGDLVLALLGGILRDALRADDSAVRTGGDEFVVLLADADLATAHRIAERIVAAAAALDIGIPVSVSAGVAQWLRGSDVADTLAHADAELYRAKRQKPAAPPE